MRPATDRPSQRRANSRLGPDISARWLTPGTGFSASAPRRCSCSSKQRSWHWLACGSAASSSAALLDASARCRAASALAGDCLDPFQVADHQGMEQLWRASGCPHQALRHPPPPLHSPPHRPGTAPPTAAACRRSGGTGCQCWRASARKSSGWRSCPGHVQRRTPAPRQRCSAYGCTCCLEFHSRISF